MGALSRRKGARTETEIVNLHRKIGVYAEKVPLSGAMAYRSNSHDVDCYPWGRDAAPLVTQVKRNPKGCKGVLEALGDADALFLRWDAEPGEQARPPIVVMPFATYERLLKAKF